MLLSINWLKDYLGKQDLKIDPNKLADELTMRGLAVDAVRGASKTLESVIVGKIEKIEKHPNADRLQVTQVRVSGDDGAEQKQIVCGANNIEEGDMVPVALPGTELPGNIKIKPTKIRGVESFGMLCSGKELELEDSSDGILQLPKHANLGEPLARLLGSNDTVLEFDLTPNRGDCLSVIGLAREICPLLKTKLREPRAPRFKVTPHRTSSIMEVQVADEEACPRYVARVMDKVKVDQSPEWIKQRLSAVGLRPINNVVDITNFVMVEYGQPLHAFDLRKLESGGIRVDRCKETGQDLTLLNGETVELAEGDLLILDGERPIALAGIMGAANTHVTEETTSIILESACFDPLQIRKTAKRLGLNTDSSKRFEKGVDIDNVLKASDRAAALMRDGFEANIYHPPIDTHPEPDAPMTIAIDMRDVRKLLGLPKLTTDNAVSLLDAIGISANKKSSNVMQVSFPTFRLDLRKTEDVIEEIARLFGYDSIPSSLPKSNTVYHSIDDNMYLFENKVKSSLSALGLRETVHFSFTSERNLREFCAPTENLIVLQKPISEELKIMRTSLLPSLLSTYRYNKNRKTENQRLFEVARTYRQDTESETGALETSCASGVLSGSDAVNNWQQKPGQIDFFFAKGCVESLLAAVTTAKATYEPVTGTPVFHPARSANVLVDGTIVGQVGEIHPFVRDQVLESKEPIALFELNLDLLHSHARKETVYSVPSKFPAVDFDLALIVDTAVSVQQMSETMEHAAGEIYSGIEVFDVYQGESIPLGKKSVAFRVKLSSSSRTLKDGDVDAARAKILDELASKHDARLR